MYATNGGRVQVAGNVHIAPGKSFQQGNMHVHDLIPFQTTEFDTSHVIDKLSFGAEYPGAHAPEPTWRGACAWMEYALCIAKAGAETRKSKISSLCAARGFASHEECLLMWATLSCFPWLKSCCGTMSSLDAPCCAGMKNPLDRVRVPRHNPRNVEGRTGAYQYFLKVHPVCFEVLPVCKAQPATARIFCSGRELLFLQVPCAWNQRQAGLGQ